MLSEKRLKWMKSGELSIKEETTCIVGFLIHVTVFRKEKKHCQSSNF